MYYTYSWDPKKAASNVKKHGVSFVEAASLFADPLAAMLEDIGPRACVRDRSVGEETCTAGCVPGGIRGHDPHHQRETRYVP